MSNPPPARNPSLPDTLIASDVSPREIERLSLPATIGGREGDRYELRRVLGIGGMGEVRLCLDRRIGREVAYKVSTAPTQGHAAPARFVREALLQARLEHPAFVPVYDIGMADDGSLFFTMRRIRGATLAEILEELASGESARFTRTRLLTAFVQLCLAIDYAHVRGIIHRDLKPANIMLGDFGEVYVLDWGIAKLSGESDLAEAAAAELEDAPASQTREGAVLGTLGYLAPEQLRGQHATLDGRADVYALGAILFEILTLSPMHRGSKLAELAASTLAGEPQSPAARAPERDVSPELDAICLRATDADRERRFESARALADAVERFLEGDRNVALRKRTAHEHAERAARALAASAEPEARAMAGREAVRALAFDPSNVDAQRTLLEVVTQPPASVPDEARVQADAAQRQAGALLHRWYANGLLAVCVGFAGLLLFTGVRDWTTFAAMTALGFTAAAVLLFGARGGRHGVQTAGFALIGATNVLLARWIGPWTIMPLAMLVNTISLTLYSRPRDRWVRVAIGTATVVMPVLLDEAGLLAPSYVVEPDRLVLFARLASFPPLLPWMITATTAAIIALAGLWLAHVLDRLAALELRAHVQAWMLRRIIAAEER